MAATQWNSKGITSTIVWLLVILFKLQIYIAKNFVQERIVTKSKWRKFVDEHIKSLGLDAVTQIWNSDIQTCPVRMMSLETSGCWMLNWPLIINIIPSTPLVWQFILQAKSPIKQGEKLADLEGDDPFGNVNG